MAEIAESAKEGLLALAVGTGLQVMAAMFGEDAERLCGPEGKHNPDRSGYRHGSEAGSVTLGGRRVPVSRPRVRAADGSGELHLPSYDLFILDRDPGPAAIAEDAGGPVVAPLHRRAGTRRAGGARRPRRLLPSLSRFAFQDPISAARRAGQHPRARTATSPAGRTSTHDTIRGQRARTAPGPSCGCVSRDALIAGAAPRLQLRSSPAPLRRCAEGMAETSRMLTILRLGVPQCRLGALVGPSPSPGTPGPEARETGRVVRIKARARS